MLDLYWELTNMACLNKGVPRLPCVPRKQLYQHSPSTVPLKRRCISFPVPSPGCPEQRRSSSGSVQMDRWVPSRSEPKWRGVIFVPPQACTLGRGPTQSSPRCALACLWPAWKLIEEMRFESGPPQLILLTSLAPSYLVFPESLRSMQANSTP